MIHVHAVETTAALLGVASEQCHEGRDRAAESDEAGEGREVAGAAP